MAEKKTATQSPIVVLNDEYQVTLDSKCLILQKKNVSGDETSDKEEKKHDVKNLGYYTTWESVGSSLIDYISKDKAKKQKELKISMEEYLNILKETREEVIEIFKNIDDIIKKKVSKK